MKLSILGVGGMGAISLSKLIAQIAIDKNLPVKSTEIHGMAKKGGLVEIYMKINEGVSPYISQRESDFCIILDELYLDYGTVLVKEKHGLIVLKKDEKEMIASEFGDVRFANSFILGKFFKKQEIFDKKSIIDALKAFKRPKENIKAFERGLE